MVLIKQTQITRKRKGTEKTRVKIYQITRKVRHEKN